MAMSRMPSKRDASRIPPMSRVYVVPTKRCSRTRMSSRWFIDSWSTAGGRSGKAPVGSQSVRSDHPVATSTNGTKTTVFYPLSPDRCFVAGPELAGELPQIVPDGRSVTDAERADVNRLMASFARKSVIASPQTDDTALREELEPVLGQRWLALRRAKRFLPEHWGEYRMMVTRRHG
jgi:hypothetical protein